MTTHERNKRRALIERRSKKLSGVTFDNRSAAMRERWARKKADAGLSDDDDEGATEEIGRDTLLDDLPEA